jgi:hypothetical protein
VSDVTCGFKLFRRDVAHAVFSRVTLDDWSFDAEALFLVRQLGYTLVEVPVRWGDAAGTKVSRGRDAVRSAMGLAAHPVEPCARPVRARRAPRAPRRRRRSETGRTRAVIRATDCGHG